MSKIRKIDYIIKEQDDCHLIFRFYPRQSSCHSFGDIPPKCWEDVFKVYYSYAIIKQWRVQDNWKSSVVFKEYCDECSVIDQVGFVCKELAKGYKTFEREDGERIPLLNRKMIPFGMGTEWTISKREWNDYRDKDIKHVYYDFVLFDCNDKGFRFSIDEKNIKEFGEYLIGCCEYMLAHGNPV